jgi:hypothetical protein
MYFEPGCNDHGPTSGALAAGMEGSAQKFKRAETEGER